MNMLLDHKAAVQKVCLALTLIALAVVIGLLYRDIQQSRILDCQQQNARHQATVSVLRTIIANAEKQQTGAEKRATEQAYNSTLLVINALAPEQNCTAAVTR